MAFWNRKKKEEVSLQFSSIDYETLEEFKQSMKLMTEIFNKAAIDLSKSIQSLNKSLNQNTAELKKQKRNQP